jgi:hypothetical protein
VRSVTASCLDGAIPPCSPAAPPSSLPGPGEYLHECHLITYFLDFTPDFLQLAAFYFRVLHPSLGCSRALQIVTVATRDVKRDVNIELAHARLASR